MSFITSLLHRWILSSSMMKRLKISHLGSKTQFPPAGFSACRYSTRTAAGSVAQKRPLGQATPAFHPHLLKPGEITPGCTSQEYSSRRKRLLDLLPNNSVALLCSHPLVIMSADIPYPFRQNSNFLYLTGFLEPDAVLVLSKRDSLQSYRSTLLVKPRDPTSEMWDGIRTGTDGAVDFLGVDEAHDTTFLPSLLDQLAVPGTRFYYDTSSPSHATFHQTILRALRPNNEAVSGIAVNPLDVLIQNMRLIKSEAELKNLHRSCEIASQGFLQVMKKSRAESRDPSRLYSEHILYSQIEHEMRKRGAERLSFPPVIAGGPRANTLHYISN
eukprot:Sdes_comp21504_c0_seq1m20125